MKNGIRSERFRFSPADREEIRKQYGITDEQILVGCVARITEQKNPFFLLEIFSLLHRQDNRYRLMMVGDGSLREQVEAKIVGLGLQEYVVLTGPRDDAYRYYSALDVFVLPSLFEGLGISFVEAQTNGLPTFASLAVPQEATISDLIEYLPLEDGAELWARRILASEGRKESPETDERYDIRIHVKELEDQYLKLREQEGRK
jgi:glycosyltransferase involved in cell wall biosynthesis